MSRKLSKIKVVRINGGEFYVSSAKKQLGDIALEFERYERDEVNEIVPVAFTDRHRSGKTFAEILEAKEFTADDLPFSI